MESTLNGHTPGSMMQNVQWGTNFEFTPPQPPGNQQNNMSWQQQYNVQLQQQNGNNFVPYGNNNMPTGQNEFGGSVPFTCNPQPFSQNNPVQSNTLLSGSGLTFSQMTQYQSGQPNNFSGGQYSGGTQTFSTGSPSIPGVAQPFSSEPQSFSNGSQSSVGGSQPYAAGVQTFTSSPQNFTNGTQPFPQAPQNFTNGLQSFSENAQNFTNSPQSFPQGQQNFTNGPQSFIEHSQNFTNDNQFFTQGQQNVTNSTPPYTQSPQSFVNSPQSFPQAPQNFTNVPQAFPEGSQNFTSGPQPFPQESQNFTGGPQPFPQSQQNFTLGPQCTPSQNVPWGPQPFPEGSHYFPNGLGPQPFPDRMPFAPDQSSSFPVGQSNFTKGHQTFQNNPQFLLKDSQFAPRVFRQRTPFKSGPRNPNRGSLPRQPTARNESPNTGRKWTLRDVVSSPGEQNSKDNAHCTISEREKEYLANDSLKLPPVLKFKGFNSSRELLAKVDQVVSKLMLDINSDINSQSDVNATKVSFCSRLHKLMYDKENTTLENMYEMYRTNYSLEDDRKLLRGEKQDSQYTLQKKIILSRDGRSKPVPKYSVQVLKGKVHAALEIKLSEIIYKMSEIYKQENNHNNAVESENTTKGQSSSTLTEAIKQGSVQAETAKSKTTTVGITTRIEAKKVSNQQSNPKRNITSNQKRIVEYDESSDEDTNTVSDRQSDLIKTDSQKLNESKNKYKVTDVKKEDIDINDDSTQVHLDNRIKAIMKQCLVMMLQRYKRYLATLIVKDEGFMDLLQHRGLSLTNLTKQKTLQKYFVQIVGRPRMPAPVIMKRFLDRFAQVSIARLKLQRQGLILAIATQEKYDALLRLNNYALGGQVLKIQSVARDNNLQWKCGVPVKIAREQQKLY